MWYIHTMLYYWAIKRNEVLIYATTCNFYVCGDRMVGTVDLEGWEGSTGPGAPWIVFISLPSASPLPIPSCFLYLSTLSLGPLHVSAGENSFQIWLLPCIFWDVDFSTFTCHHYNHTSFHFPVLGKSTSLSVLWQFKRFIFYYIFTQKISLRS